MKRVIGGVGFHGNYTEEVEVGEEDFWGWERIRSHYREPYWFPKSMVAVTEEVIARLSQNACGMRDCICGSGPRIFDSVGDKFLIYCEEEKR